MTKIAFLGLGAMGSRMAKKIRDAGHELVVWNRSANKMEDLVKAGAIAATSPRAAAMDAEIVISMVRDDGASYQVWLDPEEGAFYGLSPSAIAVDCSTVSVAHAREMSHVFTNAGRDFVEAPLAGSRPQADAGQLIFLTGGKLATLKKIEPLLTIMGSAHHYAGDVGAGAAVKLMINSFFGVQLAAIAELLGFAVKVGIDPMKAVEILGKTPVCSPAAKGGAEAMLCGAYAPAFPIDLVVKDFGLTAKTSEAIAATIPLSTKAGEVFENGLKAGFGGDNITGIFQLYHPQS